MILQLASTSPRRQELLTKYKIPYQVVPTDAEERMDTRVAPQINAMTSGWLKAHRASAIGSQGLILGCDTIVVCCGEILEKPKDLADARRMITLLSGKTHEVISGFGLIDRENQVNIAEFVVSQVTVRTMSEDEIEELLATGEHEGKSGSYMVQGRMRNFITHIEGSVDSIIGLPVAEICNWMKKEGYRYD